MSVSANTMINTFTSTSDIWRPGKNTAELESTGTYGGTVKPVSSDHLYNKLYHPLFIH